MNRIRAIALLCISAFTTSCMTTLDLARGNTVIETKAETAPLPPLEDEKPKVYIEIDEQSLVEKLSNAVKEKEIVYVEKPIYRPQEEAEPAQKPLSGTQAAKQALDTSLKSPGKFQGAVAVYDFDEQFVYEIYCATYRITDIILEPGEEVWETPFLSEPEVWQVGAGVSKTHGIDTQHFFIKPSLTKLTTTMIIITNRRVYHILLKSYKEDYMAIVQWNYPTNGKMPMRLARSGSQLGIETETALEGIMPEHVSFDYSIKYPTMRKPAFLPQVVYDDGRRTYIVVDKRVLFSELPALFNGEGKIINYRVKKNIFIVDELITKVTLKLQKSYVVIEKKITPTIAEQYQAKRVEKEKPHE